MPKIALLGSRDPFEILELCVIFEMGEAIGTSHLVHRLITTSTDQVMKDQNSEVVVIVMCFIYIT